MDMTYCHCGCEETVEKKKGPHTGIYCAECDTWLKWKPKARKINPKIDWKQYKMPFGKHKGIRICDLPKTYLKWGAENIEDENLQEMFKIAFEAISKVKVRGKFPNVDEKDIYQLVDHKTDEVLQQCSLNELPTHARSIWPKYSMPHPGFIIVEHEIVGRVEFKAKYKKKEKNEFLFDEN
jgi:uncharacterized protein (DUF3820 family)